MTDTFFIHGAPGSFEGTLTTETGGVRKVAARSCDDVTAAFAVIIAMADELQPADKPREFTRSRWVNSVVEIRSTAW